MPETQYSVRLLVGAGFVDYLGSGLFLALSAVYFTQHAGLPAWQVGAGLGLGGSLALLCSAPVGRLADRLGTRRVLVALHLARAAGTAGYMVVGGWPSFLAAACLVTVADQGIVTLTQALAAELAGAGRRERVMAHYRTVANLAISAGGLLGGLLTASGTRDSFQVVLLANAAAYVVVAALLLTLRTAPRASPPDGLEKPSPPGDLERPSPWRNPRLLTLAGLDTLLQLWQPVLNLGFPLWLALQEPALRPWIGPLYAINTVLCVLLQLPAARLTATPEAARRRQAAGAVLLAAACLGYWAGWFAAATVLLTLGELLAVSAAWTLSYALAPAEGRAEHLAVFGMGRSFSRYVLGPILVTGLLQLLGGPSWAVLAGLFVAAAAATLAWRPPATWPGG
ncbi:MFS transporter [Nonomuraea sp. NPDC050310]|uniref:MFS transporter n=1 Tax=Nonomuraea sp. NPDC050310 TaxID=3154935 RepID=UPI0033CB6926